MAKSGKIALVTGANKGIGFEVARQLAQKGFRVFIGARNEKAGRTAAQKIGPATKFLKIDVSDPRSIRESAAELAKATDHLDVLVNNAGIIVDGDDAILKQRRNNSRRRCGPTRWDLYWSHKPFSRCWRNHRRRESSMSRVAEDNCTMAQMAGHQPTAFRRPR